MIHVITSSILALILIVSSSLADFVPVSYDSSTETIKPDGFADAIITDEYIINLITTEYPGLETDSPNVLHKDVYDTDDDDVVDGALEDVEYTAEDGPSIVDNVLKIGTNLFGVSGISYTAEDGPSIVGRAIRIGTNLFGLTDAEYDSESDEVIIEDRVLKIGTQGLGTTIDEWFLCRVPDSSTYNYANLQWTQIKFPEISDVDNAHNSVNGNIQFSKAGWVTLILDGYYQPIEMGPVSLVAITKNNVVIRTFAITSTTYTMHFGTSYTFYNDSAVNVYKLLGWNVKCGSLTSNGRCVYEAIYSGYIE